MYFRANETILITEIISEKQVKQILTYKIQ